MFDQLTVVLYVVCIASKPRPKSYTQLHTTVLSIDRRYNVETAKIWHKKSTKQPGTPNK